MKIATGLLCLISLALTIFPQQPTSERTVALIFRDPERVEMVTESQARTEYERLLKIQEQTPSADARFVALVHALGTIPNRCTAGQVYAGLCLPEQLETKEKH